MDIDFRKLLEAPKLRALFLEDSGLEERELVELLETDPKEAWGMINPEGAAPRGSGRTRKSPAPKFTPFTRVLVQHSKGTA